MKKSIFVMAIAMFIFSSFSYAQQAFKMPVDEGSKISFESFNDDIDIEGTDGKELLITCSKNPVKSERSKGLTAVYPKGEDNTNMGLSINKNDNTIEVVLLADADKYGPYKIKVPNSTSLFVKKNFSNKKLYIQSFRGEIELKTGSGHSTLKDITGPIVYSTVAGLIEIAFKTVSQTGPISISSVSAEIDVTVPEKTKANIELQTISGEFFTDFNLKPTDEEKKQHYGSNTIKSALNGGGVDFKLSTVSGKIYLRKAK